MDTTIKDQLCLTVPDEKKVEVVSLCETSRDKIEERLRQESSSGAGSGYERGHGRQSNSLWEIKRKAERSAVPVAIAELIMNIWSPKMRKHVEKLIFNKAVEERYLESGHLKFVKVLDEDKEDDTDWIIEDQNDAVVNLVWNTFNLREHFRQVQVHRLWIKRSYERLKEFMPSLCPEIIERHDLSKFAFSQAVGYTLKFVHNSYHGLWQQACDFHLHNEPHHPQTWSKLYTPEEKRMKLEIWTRGVCDFQNGYPYGVNLETLDFASENLAEVFLFESFVDMVALEWERKKGQDLDITTAKLVYMDDVFLSRYAPVQHRLISHLMKRVTCSDTSVREVNLSEKEKSLLSIVREEDRAVVITEITNQKKKQVQLLEGSIRRSAGGSREGLAEEMQKQASDMAYNIVVAYIISELWSHKFRKHVESLVLKKAIEEQFIEEDNLQWIFLIENKVNQMEVDCDTDFPDIDMAENDLVKLVWEDFNVREHFSQMKSHRSWLMQTFKRLGKYVPELPEEVVRRHDLSKFAFSQAIGYTLKWVHGIHHPIWTRACSLHLNNEPHHPEMWSHRHTPALKQTCLETWLCVQVGGAKYGVEISILNLASEDMAKVFLYESFLDMVAVEWERKKGQRLDISTAELVDMEDKYLNRYSESQHKFISNFMRRIAYADTPVEDLNLTEKEKCIISSVREEDRGFIMSEIEMRKKEEYGRLLQHVRQSGREVSDEEIRQRAHDNASRIGIATVVTEYWDHSLRKQVEKLILEKAVQERFIAQHHLQWVFVIDDRVPPMEVDNGTEPSDLSVTESDLVKLVWEDLNVQGHYTQMKSHREWIMHSFHRLAKYMPELQEEVADRHDLSKFAFSQAIGYTLKWIHGIHHPIWTRACDLHLNNEPHHPEMWSHRHSPAHKQSCLETWLCVQAGGAKYGVEISTLSFTSEDMARAFLYESVVDMVAVEWEKTKKGRQDLTDWELVRMNTKYFSRFSLNDKAIVMRLMTTIREN